MGDYNADPSPDLPNIRQVAFGYRFAPQTNLKVDQFSTTTSNKVFSLTRKLGSTRLRVLVDPSLLPQGI